MVGKEIEIPKEIIQYIPENVHETSLGQKNGAKKQYRYGNLHIREYEDKFLVHMDKVDPRKNAIGHLFQDAPEILIGLISAVVGGTKIATLAYNHNKNSKSKGPTTVFTGILSSILIGYAAYSITKNIKNKTR